MMHVVLRQYDKRRSAGLRAEPNSDETSHACEPVISWMKSIAKEAFRRMNPGMRPVGPQDYIRLTWSQFGDKKSDSRMCLFYEGVDFNGH
jgi:hypothetical protein